MHDAGAAKRDLARALPQALPDEVTRHRLIGLLDRRWSHRVTTVTAPGGFGKTRALRQALLDNATDPVGADVYHRVTRVSDVSSICRALCTAMRPVTNAEPAAAPDPLHRLVASMVEAEPTSLCLVLDDVHLIADNESIGSWLNDVIDAMPDNGRILLAGRSMPALRLARLDAESAVLRVGADELRFDVAEAAQLRDRHDPIADPDHEPVPFDGWPALLRLAVTAGESGALDYLLQEVLDDLDVEHRRALTAACVAGTADAALFAALGIDVDIERLAAAVPLIEHNANGSVKPHDLWVEVLDSLEQPDRFAPARGAIARWHFDQGRYDPAVTVAFDSGDAELALHLIAGSRAAINDTHLSVSITRRWLDRVPAELSDHPGALLLQAIHRRISGDPGSSMEHIDGAVAGFRARGDDVGESIAVEESFFLGWLTADTERISAAATDADRLGNAALAGTASLALMEMQGDFVGVHQVLTKAVGPRAAEVQLRYAATMALLAGDPAASLERLEQLIETEPSGKNRSIRSVSRFAVGLIDEAADNWERLRYQTSGNHRDDLLSLVFSCWIDACLGYQPRHDLVEQQTPLRGREVAFVTVSKLVTDLMAGSPTAEVEFDSALGDEELQDPLLAGELRRFIAVASVASPKVRSLFRTDALSPPLSPFHRDRANVAELLLATRNGGGIDTDAYPGHPTVISSLPLPLTVELAAGLGSADPALAADLTAALIDRCGSRVRPWLDRLAASDHPAAAGASQLLASLPTPPAEPTRVITQDRLELERNATRWSPKRTRVRQLLSLLVLERQVPRDRAASLLWPAMSESRARQNLSVTLTYLRAELEPDRPSNAPSFHLRLSGDHLALHRSDLLDVDLWNLLADHDASDHRASDHGAADPVEHWHGVVLRDLREIDGLDIELGDLDRRLTASVAAAGRSALAAGNAARAHAAGERLLDNDPYDEQGHALVIAAAIHNNDWGEAHRGCARYVNRAAEIDVPVSDAVAMLMRQAGFEPDEAQ